MVRRCLDCTKCGLYIIKIMFEWAGKCAYGEARVHVTNFLVLLGLHIPPDIIPARTAFERPVFMFSSQIVNVISYLWSARFATCLEIRRLRALLSKEWIKSISVLCESRSLFENGSVPGRTKKVLENITIESAKLELGTR